MDRERDREKDTDRERSSGRHMEGCTWRVWKFRGARGGVGSHMEEQEIGILIVRPPFPVAAFCDLG